MNEPNKILLQIDRLSFWQSLCTRWKFRVIRKQTKSQLVEDFNPERFNKQVKELRRALG